jgi:hypothetical protein
VFGDLVTLGKLPVAYQSVGVLDDPKDAALLARAINETSKGGRDWNDILGTVAGKPVAQDIRNTIHNDPNVQQLMRSLSASAATVQQVDAIEGSIATLAFGKRFYNQDSSAAANAALAFTGKYGFIGDARVPKDAFDSVSANAGTLLSRLNLGMIQVPDTFRTSNLPEDVRQHPTAPAAADYLLSIQSNPTWITRGDALWLLDNEARVVRDKAGRPITVPFYDKSGRVAPMPAPQVYTPEGDVTNAAP